MTNYANGVAFDSNGDLWRAEMGGPAPGRITRVNHAGSVELSIERSATGAAFHTPDDLIFRSDGTLYFTDPTFEHGPYTSSSLLARPIYRVTPEAAGSEVILEDQITGPNGIELSPDERSLYVPRLSMIWCSSTRSLPTAP